MSGSSGDVVVREGRVLRLRLAGGRANALDADAMTEAAAVLRGLATADQAAAAGIGAVLVAHDGPNFCVGGDVRSFAAAQDRGAFVRELAETFHELLEAYVGCAVPTVAGVQGWAAGAGMSLVLATDLVVAGSGTHIRPGYPGIGFSTDGGLTWTLPRVVGLGRARHILLTDQVLGAEDLLGLGIASALVDDGDIAQTAETTAARVAQGPTAALGRIKALLLASSGRDLQGQLAAETEAIAASAAGPEGAEGLAAFAEGRTPHFHG